MSVSHDDALLSNENERTTKQRKELPFPGIPLHVVREGGAGGMLITGDGLRVEDDQGDLRRSLYLGKRQRVGSLTPPIKKTGWSIRSVYC